MAKLLVTHVLWTLGYGGAERMVLALSKELPRHGYAVRVIAAAGGGLMEGEFRAAGIPLEIGPRAPHAWQRGRTARFLRQTLSDRYRGILHTHLGADVWGGLVAGRSRIHPWITTIHDRETRYTGVKRWLRTQAIRRMDHVACISEDVERSVIERYGSVRSHSVIRLGVDVPEYVDTPVVAPSHLPRLLAIGRFVPEKGFLLLIEALANIREPWTLTILGDGPERRAIEECIERYGLRARVHLPGFVSNVTDYIRRADIFCQPSTSEGQGLALLEASAYGVPVITNDLPALRETLDDHSLTFVSEHTIDTWTSVLERAMTHPLELQARAHSARRIVSEQFSLDRMVREYVEVYRRVLD